MQLKNEYKKVMNNKGVGIVMTMVIASVVTIIVLATMDYIRYNSKAAKNLDLKLKLKLLTEDVLEVGKYLLFYEQVFSLENPKTLSGDFASLTYGVSSSPEIDKWHQACNLVDYKDIPSDFKADSAIGREKAFCSVSLRDSAVTGKIFNENMERIANSTGSPIKKVAAGEYVIDASGLVGLEGEGIIFPIEDLASDFIKFHIDDNTKAFIKPKSLKLEVKIFTESSGFVSADQEKFIRLRAKVNYGSKKELLAFGGRTVVSEETIMLRTASAKEFALFLGYPLYEPYPAATPSPAVNILKAKTTPLDQVLRIEKDSNIYGKVYHRGTLDLSKLNLADPTLSNIPYMKDYLVLGGDVINYPGYGEDTLEAMKAKFQKGIFFGYSDEYLFDNHLAKRIFKTGGLDEDLEIIEYLDNFSGAACVDSVNGTADPGRITLDSSGNSSCEKEEVGSWGLDFVPFKGFYLGEIENNHEAIFIMAPVGKLENIHAPSANIMGVIFGGVIHSPAIPVNIFALGSLHKGIGGIGTEEVLQKINNQANLTNTAIGFPLNNLPLVMKGF